MCTVGGNIRVGRVAASIERTHLISVNSIRCQSGAVVSGDIGTDLSNFDEVRAASSLTTFNLETIFITGTVSPTEIDLGSEITVVPKADGAEGAGGG